MKWQKKQHFQNVKMVLVTDQIRNLLEKTQILMLVRASGTQN